MVMTDGRPQPRSERREPLWDRVDRNRVRLAGYVVLFIGGSAIGSMALAAVPLAFVRSLLIHDVGVSPWGLFVRDVAVLGGVMAAIAAGWATFTLLRSEKWLLARFSAVLVPTGELLDTKFALKDMAIAAGLPVAPALYRIPESNTNAFVFSANRRRPVIGITEGFTAKLTLEQQRAVFAHLVARLAAGDTIVSTGITALMWPMHAWREARLVSDEPEFLVRSLDAIAEIPDDRPPVDRGGAVFYIVFVAGFSLLAEFVAAGHRGTQLTTAEKADAEGMLLLKDPVAMLSALTAVIERNNVVTAAGETFAELFYCWTGIASDDEEDPEWRRVARLREVLGVMGVDTAPAELPDGMLVAPVAPRITDTQLQGREDVGE
ncbi:MAG: M48 family metalloprotease [Coriobacteriia bacterium]|nr:M48 family metalloprotease [Coriobacteriia bacterium]